MEKGTQKSRKETEFALAALMEIPSQYKATIDLGILGYADAELYSLISFLRLLLHDLWPQCVTSRRHSGTSPRRVPLPPPTGSSPEAFPRPKASGSAGPKHSSSSYPYHRTTTPTATAPVETQVNHTRNRFYLIPILLFFQRYEWWGSSLAGLPSLSLQSQKHGIWLWASGTKQHNHGESEMVLYDYDDDDGFVLDLHCRRVLIVDLGLASAPFAGAQSRPE